MQGIPEYAKGSRRLGSATHRLMESYKDDYPSHAKGIFQEAIQNSIDARAGDFKDDRIVLDYDHETRILRIRDYGTTGMSHCKKCYWGRRPDTGDDCCHEKDCKWGNFHYLGGLAKGSMDLGSRGQGKSLMVVAGERMVVRTKIAGALANEATMASQWTQHGDDWEWELVPDQAMKPSDSPGTEIIIYGVVEEVHQELLERDEIVGDISRTWFAAIENGVQIRYGHGGKDLTKVPYPHFPPPAVTEDGKTAKRSRSSIPVTHYRKLVGELKDFELFLAVEPIPEELRGIALVKNGTQVIKRLQDWGRRLRPELQDRLYGWARYYCTEEQPFLQLCERPGHRDFKIHPYVRRVTELLQGQVEEFLSPYEKQLLKPKLTEKDRKRAKVNLDIVRKALEEVSEFNPWSGEGSTPRPRSPQPVPNHPYISTVTLDKESYQYDDNAIVSVIVLNPTAEFQPFIHLTVEALDEGLSQLAVWEMPPEKLPTLNPAKEDEKGKISIDVNIPVTKDFGPGRNWVRCTLINRLPVTSKNPDATLYDENLLSRNSHSLWVGVVPEKQKRTRSTEGGKGEDERQGTMTNLIPITDPDLDPVENEMMPFWADGEMWFFTKGARIGLVYETQPRTADSILYELIAEEISSRILERSLELDARESFDKNQVLGEFARIDELRRKFLRACEKQRSITG